MPKVRVTLRGREKPWTRTIRTKSGVVEEVIQEMGINPLEVLVRVNGEFMPDTDRVRTGDRIELLEITSRG